MSHCHMPPTPIGPHYINDVYVDGFHLYFPIEDSSVSEYRYLHDPLFVHNTEIMDNLWDLFGFRDQDEMDSIIQYLPPYNSFLPD